MTIDYEGLPTAASKDRQKASFKNDRQEPSVKEYQHPSLHVEHREAAKETNGGEKSIDTLKGRQASLKKDRQSTSNKDLSFTSSQELIESAALIFKSSTEHERSQSYRQTKDRQELFDNRIKQKSASFVHRPTEKEEIEKVKEKDERKSKDLSENSTGKMSTIFYSCES